MPFMLPLTVSFGFRDAQVHKYLLLTARQTEVSVTKLVCQARYASAGWASHESQWNGSPAGVRAYPATMLVTYLDGSSTEVTDAKLAE